MIKSRSADGVEKPVVIPPGVIPPGKGVWKPPNFLKKKKRRNYGALRMMICCDKKENCESTIIPFVPNNLLKAKIMESDPSVEYTHGKLASICT